MVSDGHMAQLQTCDCKSSAKQKFSWVSYMLADKCRPFLKHLIGVMTKPTSF